MGKMEKSAELGSNKVKNVQCCIIAECSFWRKRFNEILQKEQQMVITKPQGRNAS